MYSSMVNEPIIYWHKLRFSEYRDFKALFSKYHCYDELISKFTSYFLLPLKEMGTFFCWSKVHSILLGRAVSVSGFYHCTTLSIPVMCKLFHYHGKHKEDFMTLQSQEPFIKICVVHPQWTNVKWLCTTYWPRFLSCLIPQLFSPSETHRGLR